LNLNPERRPCAQHVGRDFGFYGVPVAENTNQERGEMPTFSKLQIPPPKNWQDFETLCCDLWRRIWKDPNTQKHGRKGQRQHGVDIYGKPDERDSRAGVQCKGKDNFADRSLTEKEVKAEVGKAKSFEPKLAEFIIATTGKRDAKIQELARKITDRHRKDHLFSVHIWAWEDILGGLADFPELIEKHYPGLSQSTKAQKKEIDEIKETGQAILRNGAETKALVISLAQQTEMFTKVSFGEMAEGVLTGEYQAELDHSRDLLNSYNPKQALEFLQKLKERIWSKALPFVKYRLLTNSGAAKLAMNEEREAGKLFLEALQYNPQDEKALCNAALGNLLLGELEKAKTTAEKVLETNPANTGAYSIIIQASSATERFEDIISKVPEPHRNSRECAFAMADQARNKGKPEEAKKWLQTAIKNDSDDLPELKAALGEIMLDLVLQDPRISKAHAISPSDKETIEEAVKLLTAAWERVSATDLRKARLGWVVNRGIAKGLLGDSDGAIKDMDTALEVEPSNPIFIKYRAMLAHEGQDNEKSIALFKKILDAPETPEAPLMLAEVLLDEKHPDEAVTVILHFLETSSPRPLRAEANRLLIQAYIDLKNFQEAQKISDSSHAADPNGVLNLVDAARISRFSGSSEDAIALLREAAKYVTDSTPFREVYPLANELYSLEQFDDAAKLYETLADKKVDSPLTRRLLNCYYRSGEKGKALEICRSLEKQYGPLRYVSEIQSAIEEEIGDLPEAKRVCRRYLDRFPNDLNMKLRLAVVHFRSGDEAKLDEFLNSPLDVDALSLEASVQIANLYEARGFGLKTLEVMYQTRRRFFKDGQAHLKYIGFMFQKQKDAERLLDVEKVTVDTAVCVQDDFNQRQWYVIENRKDSDLSRGEMSSEHPLARKLLGKCIGDQVLLKESEFARECGKIIGIKSKYVHALHESLSLFPKVFPDTPGLIGVRAGTAGETGETPPGLQPILNLVTKQHDVHLKVQQFYKEGTLTIGAFANLVGKSVLEVWAGLMAKPDLGLRCCLGNPLERSRAISLLADKPKLIVEPISLLTLHEINAGDIVPRAFGKLGIAQSTIDLLRETLQERKGVWSKGFMAIGKDGDKFTKEEITAEDVERNVKHLEAILKWIEDNCEIIPCTAALGMKSKRKQQLDQLIGPIFADSVLIASEPGNALYSDDERLRSFAEAEFNVSGVWTQILLMASVGSGHLERDRYNQMVIKLAALNYRHTSIDALVLIEAARLSGWSPSPPYSIAVKVLGGKSCDEHSALNVGTNFLYELWKQPILAHQRDYLMLSLLDSITAERKPGPVLEKLTAHVRRRFLLLPLAERRILELIGAWKQVHVT